MPDKPTYMGLETEYGISVQAGVIPLSDYYSPVAASEVVRAIRRLRPFVDRGLEEVEDIETHDLAEYEAERRRVLEWEYGGRQHTRKPVRGALRQRMGLSGFVLTTGARWYVDMGHPEYSTPETADPYTIVLVQKAGDVIAEQCRKAAEISLRDWTGYPNLTIHLQRNNSDGQGHSYAGHENYSLTPQLFDEIIHPAWDYDFRPMQSEDFVYTPKALTHAVLKFFVTRQIITGSGKVGYEAGRPADYQISQRADFMMQPIGMSTTHHRGIINTRNQPLADHHTLRRLHVICGDSNMSELSIYLKCGITALFFKMLEQGYIQRAPGDLMAPLYNPVGAYHAVSRDLALRRALHLEDMSSTTALDTQMQYCALAASFVHEETAAPAWHDVVQKWEAVLNGLNTDRFKDAYARNLDWVVKQQFLKDIQRRHDVGPMDAKCVAFAGNYHDNDPDHSIYNKLLAAGKIMRIVKEEEIARMTDEPPPDTRAWLRGMLIATYPSSLIDIGWDYALFKSGIFLDMSDPSRGTEAQIAPLMTDNPPCEIFLERMKNLFPVHDIRRPSKEDDIRPNPFWLD